MKRMKRMEHINTRLVLEANLEEILGKIHIIDWKIFKEGYNPVWDNDEYMKDDRYNKDDYIKLLCDTRVKLEQEHKETVFHLETFMSFLSNER